MSFDTENAANELTSVCLSVIKCMEGLVQLDHWDSIKRFERGIPSGLRDIDGVREPGNAVMIQK